MIAPTLLVGLGGTGSKVVLRVANKVTEEQRKKIGFAVFDTDINELRDIEAGNPFVKTIQTSTKLSVGEYLNIDTHARDNWFPVNAILNSKTLTEGAGQVRAISRLAFDTAIRAGNMEPLHQAIENLYKVEEKQSDQALRVIIVSSLAGGTGSGLILPVGLYIKNYLQTRFQQSANITRGFFILPEVFYAVIPGQAERNNLKCNAYATLRELDAFMMKGDATLPDKYKDTVKIEFPRVGSSEFEEYDIRPYDFCFLFDAQNTEGKKLNDFNQYLDHAATCIYSQSIGPMNKRSNSSEDNTIRELCAESGRNRYAGAGSSMLVYPFEDVKKYIALKWTQSCVSDQWLMFDKIHKDKVLSNAKARAEGVVVKDTSPSKDYVTSIESLAKQSNPFAVNIIEQCTKYDDSGMIKLGESWNAYMDGLVKYVEGSLKDSTDLEQQKEQAMARITGVEGGKDVWNQILECLTEMKKYSGMSEKRSEEVGRTMAYTLFRTKDSNAINERLPHQIETYLRDGDNNFLHPNAVRYFLYKTAEIMKNVKNKAERDAQEEKEQLESIIKSIVDDPKTQEEETEEQLTTRKADMANNFGKISDRQKSNLQSCTHYLAVVDDYRKHSVLNLVLDEGMNFIKNMSEAFETFYNSFDSRIEDANRELSTIAKKYNHTSGRTTRYVCASKVCLEKMVETMPYTGTVISIDSKLAETIYARVKNYSMLTDKSSNADYFVDIYNNSIVGYFKDKLMTSYGTEVDMDIISALEKEAKIEGGQSTDSAVEQYVIKAIEETRKLSSPFIERPLGEQKASIPACTYNNKLDPKDDSPKSALIAKYLANSGGVADEDIGLNMIMFYQSIYGLRANRLSKFAPGSQDRGPGEYYKAYFELINQIKPKSDKTPVITPHIDRNWHIVSKMPDLDERNQVAQENRVYRAFFLALVLGMIEYTEVSRGKYLYKLQIKDLKPEEFVVSNGTPCDCFYEVLDALTINPVIVTNILKSADRIFLKEQNASDKVTAENSELFKGIDGLKSKQYKKDNLSIFDLPALLKIDTPAADFDKDVCIDAMRVVLHTIYDRLKSLVAESEVDYTFGKFIVQQYKKFNENLSWYYKNYGNDNFSGFSQDIVKVAIDLLDDMELTEDMKNIKDAQDQLNK